MPGQHGAGMPTVPQFRRAKWCGGARPNTAGERDLEFAFLQISRRSGGTDQRHGAHVWAMRRADRS